LEIFGNIFGNIWKYFHWKYFEIFSLKIFGNIFIGNTFCTNGEHQREKGSFGNIEQILNITGPFKLHGYKSF